MNPPTLKEYQRKCTARRRELEDRLFFGENLSRTEKDIIELELMELDIMPHSLAWRWGRKSVLQRARKALEKQLKEERKKDNGD